MSKSTITAYKLFKLRKDGTLGPLFINRKQIIPVGEWLKAGDYPTKGYAHRPGWHTTTEPKAKHLSMRDRTWYKVKIRDYYRFDRPKHQGGHWLLAKEMKVVRPVGVVK
jgi:hypothetical protein